MAKTKMNKSHQIRERKYQSPKNHKISAKRRQMLMLQQMGIDTDRLTRARAK